MLGSQRDISSAQDLLFQQAPSVTDCEGNPGIWGRYIDFLAGKSVNRNGFLRLMLMIEYSQIPTEYFKQGETREAGVLRYIGSFLRQLEETSDGKIVLIRYSAKVHALPLTRPGNFAQQLSKLTLGQAKKYFPRLKGEPNKNNQIWCDAMLLTNDPDTVLSEAGSLYRSREFFVCATPHAIQDAEFTVSAGWAVYTDDLLSSASICSTLEGIAGFPVAIKHKRVREDTRNDSIVTLQYGSKFHKIAKDENAPDLPMADHFLCRPP